ncbi:MAG: DUF998 domain-containing protein [Candidatus Heimdallarchaeota archaeon]|nr:DUF998 domain-containing protein [Candidatus Heimdallarchaeota archaeon]
MINTRKRLPFYLISTALANIFYYGLLIPAALLYPGYSPFQHTVSALGNTTKNPNGWFLFSICLILIAIALIPFVLDMKKWYEAQFSVKKYIVAIQVLGLFNSFAMVMIAIFPTDLSSTEHNFWSLMNFICIELVILLAIIGLRTHPSYWNRLSIIALVDFVCCVTYLYLLRAYRPIATIFEWLTFILILAYLFLLAYNMYKEKL